jgi:hypothetical protein
VVAAVFNIASCIAEIGRAVCGQVLGFLGRSKAVRNVLGSRRVKRLFEPVARRSLKLVSDQSSGVAQLLMLWMQTGK